MLTIVFTLFLSFICIVSAESISEDLHLNIQTTYPNGTIISGTFNFVFNISKSVTCSNPVYSNSVVLTTDSLGRISYYLPSVSLNYSEQYYLCYYRNGVLIDSVKMSRTPYSFRAKNISLSGVEADSNFNMSGYNFTSSYYFGSGAYLKEVNDTLKQLNCADGQVARWNSTSLRWYCSYVSASGGGDIEAVTTDNIYLTGGGTTGTVNIVFNETKLNQTIDSKITNYNVSFFNLINVLISSIGNWSAEKYNYYTRTEIDQINTSVTNYINTTNQSILDYVENNFMPIGVGNLTVNNTAYLDGYDSSFFMPLNNSVYGEFNFNGGWTDDGVTISGGNVYAKAGYFYNISSLQVSNLNINGSLTPYNGFDNQFDLGSENLRWRNLYLSGKINAVTLNLSGDLVVAGVNIPQLILSNNVSINNTLNRLNETLIAYVNSQITSNEYNATWINNTFYTKLQLDANLTHLNTTIIQILNNGSYLNVPETDPRWTANYTNMQNPCSPNFVTGIHPNGTFICGTVEQAAETDPYWTSNYTAFNRSWSTTTNLSYATWNALNNGTYTNMTNLSYMTLDNFTLQNLSLVNWANYTINYTNYTMMQYVDARVEGSIYNDTLTRLSCMNEQVVKWNATSGLWYCSDVSADGSSDIDAVYTDNIYLTGGSSSGSVTVTFNETKLNHTIDSKITTYNQSIVSWAISTFVNISNLLNYYTKSEINDINDSVNNSMFAMNVSMRNFVNYTNNTMTQYVGIQNLSMRNYVNLQNASQTYLINLNNQSVTNYINSVASIGEPNWNANYSIFLTHATTSYVDAQNLSMRHFVNYTNNTMMQYVGIQNLSMRNYVNYANSTMKDYVDARVASGIYDDSWINNTFYTKLQSDANLTHLNTTIIQILNNGSYLNYAWNATNESYMLVSAWNATNLSYATWAALNNGTYTNMTNLSYMTLDNFTLQNLSMRNYVNLQNASQTYLINLNNQSVTNYINSVASIGEPNWNANYSIFLTHATTSYVDAQNLSMRNFVNYTNNTMTQYVGIQNLSMRNYVNLQNASQTYLINLNNQSVTNYINSVASIGEPNWNANYSNVAFTNIHETFNQNVTFLRNISVDGNTLVVDSNNNRVGVNTVAPSQTLEVAGTFKANSSHGSITLDSNGNVLIGI